MGLKSRLFQGDPKLEACLVSDPAHITPGSVGPHVGKIQQALIKLDDANIDGGELLATRYGPSTAAAVLAYKTKRRIINFSYQKQADNIVGKMTIATMDDELTQFDPSGSGRNLGRGDTGRDVVALQRLLNHHLGGLRSPLIPDGIFGPKTEEAVRDFQTRNASYPVKMPLTDPSFPRDPLKPTGVVDQATMGVLLDFRELSPGNAKFEPTAKSSDTRGGGLRFALDDVGDAPAGDPPAPPAPPNPPTTLRIITFQSGQQVSVNPWDFSPFVLTGQMTLLAKNDGRPDLLLTAGGQVALNTSGANGRWTGQGFLQMGLGGFPFAKFGSFDLLNPFVQFMIQHNHGADQGQNTAGIALGNQINWSLVSRAVGNDRQDVLSFFLNGQAVANVDLNNGKCAAPAGQFLVGAAVSFF